MSEIVRILVMRDGMSEFEAQELIEEAKEALMEELEESEFVEPAEFMSDWFGLEPDYIDELLLL